MQRFRIDRVWIDPTVIAHPLLGAAQQIFAASGDAVTALSAIEWRCPAEIPAIAAPGRLPPGTGAAILNEIATRAAGPLRYAGPYPTPALFRSLLRSFRTTGTEAVFTRELVARAANLARDPIAIDFVPAPHARASLGGDDFAEIRDGQLERAYVAGIFFERGDGTARLVGDRAEVWFGDAPYAHVATFGPDHALREPPRAIPACASPVIGREFPPALRVALAELIADAVPPPLADDARAAVASRSLAWADLGARAAASTETGFAVHAALWDRIAPLGLARLALALAEALANVVTRAIVDEASATVRG